MPLDGSGNYYYPPGTRGITDETIESEAYNNFLDDLVVRDLNVARPLHRGGTGKTTADQALINLTAEKAAQLVTNYASHVWLAGSFRSSIATGQDAPVDGHAFIGVCYLNEPLADPPTNQNVILEAYDLTNGRAYAREKKAGVWTAWIGKDHTTASPTPPTDMQPGSLWWDSETGTLYVYYDDGNSRQWVQATALDAIDVPSFLLRSGDTMTGPLTLSGAPTASLHAATKKYVDDSIAAFMQLSGLVFTRSLNQHMTRLFASTNNLAWTMSMWVRRIGFGTHQALFGVEAAGNKLHVGFFTDNSLTLMGGAAGTTVLVGGLPPQTDPGLWLNIVWQCEAGDQAAARFHTLHVNNKPAWGGSGLFAPAGINSAITHHIGQPGFYPDLFMRDVVFVDGAIVPPASFGGDVSGVWTPQTYAGPFGTNGFKLDFADRSALGNDTSGNNNHWTAVNF